MGCNLKIWAREVDGGYVVMLRVTDKATEESTLLKIDDVFPTFEAAEAFGHEVASSLMSELGMSN